MSEPTEPREPNYAARQLTAVTALAALLAGGGYAAHEAFEGSDSHESKLSTECLKKGERLDTITGTVTIPKGINRDSAPRVSSHIDENTFLYNDREEHISSPVEIYTENIPSMERWLCYLNADGKISFVAETPKSIYDIRVTDGNDSLSLAEARVRPGGVTKVTVDTVGDNGITAIMDGQTEPMPIAMIEDRD